MRGLATSPRPRLMLGAVGVAVALYGLVMGLLTIPWTSYLGIVVWLAGAVVLHDALLVPALSVLQAGAHRAGRRLPGAALALVEAAFVVGGVVTLIAVPAIWAKHLGPNNPTVLPGAYGPALLVTWSVLLVLTAAGVAVLVAVARRRTTAPPEVGG